MNLSAIFSARYPLTLPILIRILLVPRLIKLLASISVRLIVVRSNVLWLPWLMLTVALIR